MKKILIVEDDQIVANIYRNKFTVEGYQVEIALDGQAGLEQVHNFRPDVLILDLMLPKLTGVELIKRLRSEPESQPLPVVVFSNTYLSNMVQEAWKAGATKCLSKANCTPKQVIEVVRGLLSANGAPNAAPAAPVAAGQTGAPPSVSRPATAATAPASSKVSDAAFQAELRGSCIESLPATLAALRALLQGTIKSDNEQTRLKQLHELYRRIHGLTGNAAVAGLRPIAQMSEALEALLKELYEKPKNINSSSLRTVALAVDFLGLLFERGDSSENPELPSPIVLVLDDEAISRRAITYALEKAKLKSIGAEDSAAAYELLCENKFDLIFLDVDMPGMNGFELCTKLRNLPTYQKTPVVFVTSLNDLESRASSTVSGGNDFIAKPFLFIELAVRALVYVLRGRLPAAK